jgi:hypothetical protein
MMVAQKPNKVGDVVKVKDILGYSLPFGLSDGDEVKVIAIEVGFRVVEGRGNRWVVQNPNIDSGFEPCEPKLTR